MSTTSGPTLDAPGGGRPRKASVATRKLSARMDSEVADAFRLFDTVSKSISLKPNIYPTISKKKKKNQFRWIKCLGLKVRKCQK